MAGDAQNRKAELVSLNGLVRERGSLAAMARNYDALPAHEKEAHCVRYGGEAYFGDDVLKLLASHQQS